MKRGDTRTRDRLLKTAARLFGERGFRKVTVRDICGAARANVAAVNYHFGDKRGLYRQVLHFAIDTMRATSEAAHKAGEGCPADERLRRYIRVTLRVIAERGSAAWIHGLLHRELADPTPAFDIAALVDKGIRPRIDALSSLVAEILGCEPSDARVMRSVASIQAQWILYLPNPILSRLSPMYRLRKRDVDAVADHIAEFSLAGIRAVARLH